MIELWHLNNIHWFRDLPSDQLEALRCAARSETFDTRATIFAPTPEPDSVFILETGLVRIYRLGQSGSEVTLGYIHPGEVFGELTAFDHDAPRESYAEATEPCQILRVQRDAFVRALHATSSLVFEVATQVERRFKQIEARVEDLVFRSARSRLARILIQLADDFGQPENDAILIDTKLTHADLAKLVGTTRPTVSIALGELEDADLVVRDRGRFLLPRLDELRSLSERQV